jgi:hypothetical protein
VCISLVPVYNNNNNALLLDVFFLSMLSFKKGFLLRSWRFVEATTELGLPSQQHPVLLDRENENPIIDLGSIAVHPPPN